MSCLVEKKSSEELKGLLGLEEILNRRPKANRVRWYGHVLRRDSNDVLRRALDFEVVGRRGRGRPMMTWKRQGVKQVEEMAPKKEDAIDRTKCHDAVNKHSRIMKQIWPPRLNGDQTEFKTSNISLFLFYF